MKEQPDFNPQKPKVPIHSEGFALWNIGFRPFYLLAAMFGAGSIILRALQISGLFGSTYLRGAVWHGHEMLFGYATAIVASFLLTAVRNCTNQPTSSGSPLARAWSSPIQLKRSQKAYATFVPRERNLGRHQSKALLDRSGPPRRKCTENGYSG